MMKLSIIIVNYNVRYFLDQALSSVFQSETNFPFEVIVVDNGSNDDSVPWVRSHYPQVKLIASEENLGFAKANNIAAKSCEGEYVLLLNPDTLLQKDTLQKSIDFIESHPDAGALGVRMYDGSGLFLPESKRGFPGPWTSFCKITGLNELFPRSKRLNYYYMGHLDANQNQKVDVLTGAFMLIKRANYLKVGGLDEEFFMYGEDIDLCYQLHELGLNNYYLASTSIIHFKGESTKKASLKYIKTFYSAMSIYARKHYNNKWYSILSFFIQTAIVARAWIAVVARALRQIQYLIYDLAIFLVLSLLVGYIGFSSGISFWGVLALAAGFALLSDQFLISRPSYRWWPHTSAAVVFSLLVLLLTVFPWLPLSAFYHIGCITVLMVLFKVVLGTFLNRNVVLPQNMRAGTTYVLSDHEGFQAVKGLLDISPSIPEECLRVDDFRQIQFGAQTELVFDPKSVSWNEMIRLTTSHPNLRASRILSSDRKALISSSSKNQVAEVIHMDHKIDTDHLRMMHLKRKFDVSFSGFILLFSPVLWLMGKTHLISQAVPVMQGKKTWVGVHPQLQYLMPSLPRNYVMEWMGGEDSELLLHQEKYLRDYHPMKDLRFLWNFS